MKKEIEEIRKKSLHLTLGDFIDYLDSMAKEYEVRSVSEMLMDIKDDYRLIKQYYSQGVDDDMRDQFYDKLFKRTWLASSYLLHFAFIEENKTYKQAVQQAVHIDDFGQIASQLVGLEQDITMASLDGEAADVRIKELLDEQYKYRQQVFCKVFASGPLSHGEADCLRDCILSDEIDIIDRRILCSALFMAQMCVFDVEKLRILSDIVIQTTNLQVKEHALVGILLALPGEQEERLFDEEIDGSFSLVMALPGMEQEVAELQVQLLTTLETPTANQHMKDNIIPFILKSRFANPTIEESEEQKLDDILHPEHEEEEMQKVEGYAKEVHRLMKEGKDIFYAGFAQTKRYPMFYTLVNWFMPFYKDHPVLRGNHVPEKLVQQMASVRGFCDSDMYSFTMVFNQTYSMLPEELRDMMEKGETVPDFEPFSAKDPTNIRRIYVQQLYRFFNLWVHKDEFRNPFRNCESLFFMNRDMVADALRSQKFALQIARQLNEKGYKEVLKKMLSNYANWLSTDWLLLASENAEKLHDHITAMMMLTVAESLKPNDNALKLRRIELQMNNGIMPPQEKTLCKLLEDAKEDDDVEKIKWLLARTYIIKSKTELNKSDGDRAVDEFIDENTGRNEEPEDVKSYLKKAEDLLVELIQADPDRMDYVLELLDCCLIERRFEAVINILKQVDEEKITSQCYLKQGLSQIMLGRIPDAVESLKKLCQKEKLKESAAIRTYLRNALECQSAFVPEVEDWFNSIEIVIDLVAE